MTIEQPAKELPDTPELPKTPGEKFYDRLQFTVGKGAIIVVTAALAYLGRYGKDSYRGVPNVFKHFQHWMHDKMLHNPVLPLAEKGESGRRLADAIANTMLLF